jgi:hypothetical protein
MKALLTAVAVVLAVSTVAPVARADGPRASSEHRWPGMSNPGAVSGYAYPVYQVRSQSDAAPQYVWQEGYSHGGQWQGGWVLVR